MLTTYDRLSDFLADRTGRTVPSVRNTVVHRLPNNSIAVRYHQTNVVVAEDNGNIVLNTGGWQTSTTKARINEYTNARVYQKKGSWYLGTGQVFFDHIIITNEGVPLPTFAQTLVASQGAGPRCPDCHDWLTDRVGVPPTYCDTCDREVVVAK